MRRKARACKRVKSKSLSWQFIGASMRGSSHEKLNLPCQDAHYFEHVSPEMILVAVADGAGSAALSDIGATVAVQTAIRELHEFFLATNIVEDSESIEAAIFDSIAAAKIAVEVEAKARNENARAFASTLLLAIATHTFVAVAQIGDGGIVIKDKQGNIIGLTIPETSEYINETCFLISPNALEHTQVRVWRGEVEQLALFSDGLQLLCLKMPEGTPYDRFFEPLFDFAKKTTDVSKGHSTLREFLSSTKIRSNTDDDVTLILATFGES